MNFDLSEEEEMLKALAERFVKDRYQPEMRRAYLASESGFSADNWALLGELGLISAMFAERDGGLGIGPVGLATIFEALGRGLVVEPLIDNIAIAAALFAATAGDDLKQVWMDALAIGEKRVAFAHREQPARRSLTWVETRAVRNGAGTRLTGTKSLVPGGDGVDAYIVTARTSGQAGDRDGIGLYLVQANSAGLSANPWRLVDGSVAVSLTLDSVEATPLGGGMAQIETAFDRAALLQSAEALGIMEKLFADTRDYLRTRQQFGKALGTFQAIQHRMVAQYAVLEQARALLNLAMMAEGPAAHRAIHGAKAYISDASVTLGHEMIQFHGGMGVTDELIIGHGHKRLLMLSRWPEDATASLDRYAAA